MAKPRIFFSSTCFDLRDARAALSTFFEERGFEVLRSETESFGVDVDKHSHDACLAEVDNADFLLLIVGGRHGGTYVASEESITNEEYNRAKKRFIPIFVFVAEEVSHGAKTYAKNPNADMTHCVDDTRIFAYLDKIRAQERGNWVFDFSDVEHIKRIMTAQLAHLALLYSTERVAIHTRKPKDDKEPLPIVPLATDFSVVTERSRDDDEAAYEINGLRTVYEGIKRICLEAVSGKDEKLKTLWLFGKYGEALYGDFGSLRMEEPRFKQYAWGVTRGQRVFIQLRDFGIEASYDFEELDEGGSAWVYLSFSGDHAEQGNWALQDYVAALERAHDEHARALFNRGDMSVYTQNEQTKPESKGKKKATSKSI